VRRRSVEAVLLLGQNFWGQIGDGTNTARLTPALVAGDLRFRQVVTGSDHSCAVTQNHRVYCWGQNRDGQVGDGTHTDRLSPVLVTVQK
jgi:alpha-tubulin suppressor-like RCC1 family protein